MFLQREPTGAQKANADADAGSQRNNVRSRLTLTSQARSFPHCRRQHAITGQVSLDVRGLIRVRGASSLQTFGMAAKQLLGMAKARSTRFDRPLCCMQLSCRAILSGDFDGVAPW